jgi:hypothetical protein
VRRPPITAAWQPPALELAASMILPAVRGATPSIRATSPFVKTCSGLRSVVVIGIHNRPGAGDNPSLHGCGSIHGRPSTAAASSIERPSVQYSITNKRSSSPSWSRSDSSGRSSLGWESGWPMARPRAPGGPESRATRRREKVLTGRAMPAVKCRRRSSCRLLAAAAPAPRPDPGSRRTARPPRDRRRCRSR